MLKVLKILSGQIETNCFIIYDDKTKKALIIDPGEDGDKVIGEIEKYKLIPEMLVNTHGHYDHILADDQIRKKYNIPLAVHKDEISMITDSAKNGSLLFGEPKSINKPDIELEDGQEIKLSFTDFKVIHTPGHTKGGICLLFDGFLITGDTLFAGTIGRTDFPGSSYDEIKASLEKIKKLDPSLIIYPGHGSRTTLANELRHNPFLNGSYE